MIKKVSVKENNFQASFRISLEEDVKDLNYPVIETAIEVILVILVGIHPCSLEQVVLDDEVEGILDLQQNHIIVLVKLEVNTRGVLLVDLKIKVVFEEDGKVCRKIVVIPTMEDNRRTVEISVKNNVKIFIENKVLVVRVGMETLRICKEIVQLYSIGVSMGIVGIHTEPILETDKEVVN